MKKYFLILGLSAIIFSCSKGDDENTPCETTVAGLSGSYQLTAFKYKPPSTSTELDWYALMESCSKDNIITFNNNGIYAVTDGPSTCDEGSDAETGSWQLAGNVISSDGEYYGTIQSYNCKTLVLVAENNLEEGDRATFTLTKK